MKKQRERKKKKTKEETGRKRRKIQRERNKRAETGETFHEIFHRKTRPFIFMIHRNLKFSWRSLCFNKKWSMFSSFCRYFKTKCKFWFFIWSFFFYFMFSFLWIFLRKFRKKEIVSFLFFLSFFFFCLERKRIIKRNEKLRCFSPSSPFSFVFLLFFLFFSSYLWSFRWR